MHLAVKRAPAQSLLLRSEVSEHYMITNLMITIVATFLHPVRSQPAGVRSGQRRRVHCHCPRAPTGSIRWPLPVPGSWRLSGLFRPFCISRGVEHGLSGDDQRGHLHPGSAAAWGSHRASASPGAHLALQWLVAARPVWGPKALRCSCSYEHGHSADLLLCLPSLHSLEAQT